MSFDNPLVDLLVRLEQAAAENATAFVVVTTDAYTGDVLNATGRFDQPEQALAEAGRMDAEWRSTADNPVEAESLRHTVVPLWEPSR